MEGAAAFGHRIPPRDGADARSSSSISSPPNSPPQIHGNQDTIRVARPPYLAPGFPGEGVADPASASSANASNGAAHATNSNASTHAASTLNGATSDKPKRQRKKKDVGPDGKPLVEDKPKEKKPRKPREPKDKAAAANGEKPTTSRAKKQKTEEKPLVQDAPAQPRQPTILETFNAAQHQQTPAPSTSNPAPLPPPAQRLSEPTIHSSVPQAMQPSNAPAARPFSSGQNYDPIRGSTRESVPARPSAPTSGTPSAQASPHFNRASASPAISSLIDPPTAIKAPALASSQSPQISMQQPFVSTQQSPTPNKTTSAFAPLPQTQRSPPPPATQNGVANMDGAMEIDSAHRAPTIKDDVPQIKKAPSKSSSSAPTPKQMRPTPEPPKGTGSGLLSTSDLFGGPSTSEPTERRGVNIDIRIPLNPRGGNTVNIAQEIVKKYGRDAINPRAAAHREQLLRIAAEQNKFADGTGDDMSVDLTSDVEDNSNVEMGGMDDEKSNTGLETDNKPVRKRRRKVEEYDKDDDFIDDTELAWQEQAAVAKDGFFVYSGSLVPEGETPQIESAAPTRGRGSRSRGRGGRGGSSGTTHASLADKSRDAPSSTRGKSRATRGTGAPRKPRITKADRERMENEKIQRERAGGVGGQSSSSATATASSTLAPPTQHLTSMAGSAAQPMGTQMQQPSQHQHQAYAQPMGSMA